MFSLKKKKKLLFLSFSPIFPSPLPSPPSSLPAPTALSVLAHQSQTRRVPLPTLLSPSLWAILALTSLRY